MAVAAVKPTPEEEPLGLDSLMAAETALAERTAGQSIVTLGNEKYPQTGLLGALGWVLHRRTDARLTYAQYMESRTVTQITQELRLSAGEEEAGDPKDAASST